MVSSIVVDRLRGEPAGGDATASITGRRVGWRLLANGQHDSQSELADLLIWSWFQLEPVSHKLNESLPVVEELPAHQRACIFEEGATRP